MNEIPSWAWLAAGLVPYHIEHRRPARRRRIIIIRALFWTLEVRSRRARRIWHTDWTLQIPLVGRAGGAVWAAVQRLKGPPAPPAA
jgi:nitrate reductase NapE component